MGNPNRKIGDENRGQTSENRGQIGTNRGRTNRGQTSIFKYRLIIQGASHRVHTGDRRKLI